LGDADYTSNRTLSSLAANNKGAIPVAFVNESAPFSLTDTQLNTATISKFVLKSFTPLRTNQLAVYPKVEDPIEKAILDFYNTYYGIDEEGNRRYPAEVYDEFGQPKH